MTPLPRRLLGEGIGTTALLAVIVGSGIMATRLGDDLAVALLANAAATSLALYVLITVLGPVSGAHFNPAVTLAARLRGELGTGAALAYVAVQVFAAVLGVLLAHAMFGEALWQPGTHVRSGAGQWLSEGVATLGLVLAIRLGLQRAPAQVPALVAAWIFAAYWFTASTSFANPAVTLARALTRSFAGIRPDDVAGFVAAQLVGALLALWLARVLGDAGPSVSTVGATPVANSPAPANNANSPSAS